MKRKLVFLGAMLLIAGAAFATITLNNSQVQTYQVGGVAVETDNTASATAAHMDFAAQQIIVTVQSGAVWAGGFVAGPKVGQNLTVTIDAKNGQVLMSDGRTNLKLTAAQQAAVQSVLTNFQNQIEGALVNWGVVPGTAVAN